MPFSLPRLLSKLQSVITIDAANNDLRIANAVVFSDGTRQTTAGVAVDAYARTTANGANGLAQGAYNQANVTVGIDATQNTNITTANNAAWAAFAKANNALANTTGTFAGDLTVTGNVTVSRMIVFADATTQNTAFNGNAIDSFARTTANGANGLAAGAYNQANVTIGVDTTQNTQIGGLQGALLTANANIAYILAVDLAQNTNITSVNQYAASAYAQANVTIGVDATQNTRIQSIETINTNQNTTIGIIQSVDVTQNTRLDGIEGTNLTQNTNITTANNAAWAAYAAGNTNATNITAVNQFAQSAYTKANNAFPSTGGAVTGSISVSQDVYVTGNLWVNGNTTSISANNITLNDSLIYLADQNPANIVDIGIVGHFVQGNYQHTGVVRNHLDGNWIFFSNVSTEPTTTINFAEANLRYDSITTGGVKTPTVTLNGKDLQSLEDTQNTNITSVNQFAQSGYNTANTAASNITVIQGVDLTQNTNITTANNAAWAAFAAGNTNATNITAVNQFAQSGYNTANNALANTGSLITVNGASQLYISNTTASISNTTGALVVNGGVGIKGNVSTDGIIFADGTRQISAASGTGGSSSSSLASWTVINSNYTVGNNIQLLANSTGGTFTITLPASPVTSNVIVIADGCSPNTGWSNNNVLVNPNGRTIEGIADTLALNISQSSVSLIYDGATWQVVSSTGPKGDTGSAGPAGATGNTGPAGTGSNATQRIYRFNATNNQTIFIGADAYSQTLSYNVNAVGVYLNGVFLRPTEDYVANNGTTIYLTSGSYANDALDVVTFQNMSLTAAQNTITTYTYTASNNQTSFGGADVNGLSLNYNPNNLFVTLNGLTLRSGVDYLQSNTSYIALTSGALANDEISIVAFGSFSVQGQNTQNTISTYYYTSTAGQTNFTGSDIYGRTLSYMQDGLIVVRNGSTLRNRIDYSATNGTSVSLTNATAANDEIAITAFGNFSVAANGYTQVEANNLFLTKTDANNIFASTANTYTKAQANTAFASTGKAIAMAIVFGG